MLLAPKARANMPRSSRMARPMWRNPRRSRGSRREDTVLLDVGPGWDRNSTRFLGPLNDATVGADVLPSVTSNGERTFPGGARARLPGRSPRRAGPGRADVLRG